MATPAELEVAIDALNAVLDALAPTPLGPEGCEKLHSLITRLQTVHTEFCPIL